MSGVWWQQNRSESNRLTPPLAKMLQACRLGNSRQRLG
eukprot:CAMPEP_0180324010 /NCGR_PEP_ID=MMETSP0988-20121125/37619_1 /TAXON_ID=697907 /ORGANISM="non described non described, Strain CCMP2293" /LENGTH=37 /DNA_ID= /DNA_START= /DNA_END= /DNA_ORIENTATION=